MTLEREQLAAENKSLHIKLALLTNTRHASSKAEVRPCALASTVSRTEPISTMLVSLVATQNQRQAGIDSA